MARTGGSAFRARPLPDRRSGEDRNRTDPVPPESEFENFFRRHRDPVLRYARQLAGPYADAENIAQEAWVRAYKYWSEISDPRPWVYRVVTNLTYTAHGRTRETRAGADPCADHALNVLWVSGSASIPGPDLAEWSADLSHARKQLPRQQQAAVVLASLEFTPPEIGGILGCKASTPRVHLHLGRTRLRKLLGEPAPDPQEVPRTGLEGRTI